MERVSGLEGAAQQAREMEERLSVMQKDNERLRKENEKLKREMEEMRGNNGKLNETLKEVKQKQSDWVEVKEQTEQSLKKIMQEQEEGRKQIKEQVVQVIKEKEKFVRTTIDRVKCTVIYGMKETKIINRLEREEKEKNRIRQLLSKIVEDADEAMKYVEEYHRLGKYEEDKDRPIKIKFATQSWAEEVLSRAWKLAQEEEYRKVWISKDLDMQEREIQKNLVTEAKQKKTNRGRKRRGKLSIGE